jgi:F-type H+-transporting ATPase subunit delta
MYEEKDAMLTVTITSAVELSAGQLDLIQKAVIKKYGKDVKFVVELKPAILGGVQLTIGSRMLDGSLKGKLAQLQHAVRAHMA